MLFLTQSSSEGLTKLAELIDSYGEVLGRNLVNDLSEVFHEIDIEISGLEETQEKMMECIEEKQSSTNNLINDIENAITYADNDKETLDSIQKTIKEFENEEVDIYDFIFPEGNTKAQQNEIIEKMKKLGYVFGSPEENHITVDENKSQEKPQLKVLPVANISKIDDNRFTITARGLGISVEYNQKTQKFTGKGARKYKEDLVKRLTYYFMYEAI